MVRRATRRSSLQGIGTAFVAGFAGCLSGSSNTETEDEDETATAVITAGVTIDPNPTDNTIAVALTKLEATEYVTVTVEPATGPGWEGDGKLAEVGEKDTYRAGSDGTYTLTVTGHIGDRTKELFEHTEEL